MSVMGSEKQNTQDNQERELTKFNTKTTVCLVVKFAK